LVGIGAVTGGLLLVSPEARAQTAMALKFIQLQDTSPGVAQTGHGNISGTMMAGAVRGSSSTDGTGVVSGSNSSAIVWSAGVFGESTAASGTTYGGRFLNSSSSGYGVRADTAGSFGVYGATSKASGSAYGGQFNTASTNGVGVGGFANSPTGTTYGGFFDNQSASGFGVYALSDGTAGLYAQSSKGTGTAYGGDFLSASTSGIGVHGRANASTGSTAGGYFEAQSSSGTGVIGEALNASGTTYGGYFEVNSPNGYAVRGVGNGASGAAYGGYFSTNSDTTGRGVYGYAFTTVAAATPNGVRGFVSAATAGYAVYASGDFGASGTKAFCIDHPLDIENKFLLHYSTESPFPQNFYSGNVTTDADGFAWVKLPDYFSEINANFKYQLTVIDSSDDFVMAKISKEIQGNRFQLRTSKGGVKVSWRVEADRNDAYVRFKKPKDVRTKLAEEKGKVHHPELYGMALERGLDYVVEPTRLKHR